MKRGIKMFAIKNNNEREIARLFKKFAKKNICFLTVFS